MSRENVVMSLYELLIPDRESERRVHAECVIREFDALQARAERAEARAEKAEAMCKTFAAFNEKDLMDMLSERDRAEKAEANFAKAIGILEELKANFSEDGEYSFCKSGKGHPMTIIDALHIGNITEKADALIDEWKKEQENE